MTLRLRPGQHTFPPDAALTSTRGQKESTLQLSCISRCKVRCLRARRFHLQLTSDKQSCQYGLVSLDSSCYSLTPSVLESGRQCLHCARRLRADKNGATLRYISATERNMPGASGGIQLLVVCLGAAAQSVTVACCVPNYVATLLVCHRLAA